MKKYLTISILISVLFLVIGLLWPFLVNNDYYNQNKDQILINGETDDFNTNVFSKRYVGDIELYLDKHIVSDNLLNDTPDMIINNRKINPNLKEKHFYSYRFKIKNAPIGAQLKGIVETSSVSYRLFVNNDLILEVGEVSKDKTDKDFIYKINQLDNYKTTSSDLDIIIEVGYTNILLSNLPLLSFYNQLDLNYLRNFFPILIIIFLLIIICVEVISIFKVKDSSYHTALLAIFILIFYLLSIDNIIYIIKGVALNDVYLNIITMIIYLLLIHFLCSFMLFAYNLKTNKIIKISTCISYFILLFIHIILSVCNLSYISFIIISIIGLLVLLFINYYIYKNKKYDSTLVISSTLFIFFTIIEFYNVSYFSGSNLLIFALISFQSLFIVLVFTAIYASFIIRTTKKAYENTKYEYEMEKIRSTVLQDQIKPHYIFNTLNIIRTLYQDDVKKGNEAIDLFSLNLRKNVMNNEKKYVKFSDELEYIYSFVKLENLKKRKPFEIIFNVENDNFYVPVLSIEPFVENSIKYSKVNEKEDGYIEIKEYEDDNFYYIEVIDNGVGFDINEIGNNSFGINNSISRYKMLFDCDVEINSIINIGTTIKIKINKEKEALIKNENNNS